MSINFDQTSGWYAQAASNGVSAKTKYNLARQTQQLAEGVDQLAARTPVTPSGMTAIELLGSALNLDRGDDTLRTMIQKDNSKKPVPVGTEEDKSTPKPEEHSAIIVPNGKGVVV
ncbi:MAG: hypothetical protein ABIJ26_01735 [Candidatus Margulisiibacteriota bacterium]